MRGKHGKHSKASSHYKWNDHDRMISSTGYAKLRVGRSHPLADPNGYAYEHLVVWVAAGNSRPKPGEVIHHDNGDKLDNRLENLSLTTRGQHNHHHLADRGRSRLGQFMCRSKA